ncbi:hypothetical protein KAR91_12385 [Candidatus Pacearchaeota archaeon]|nr:hypothetical protein [Candidatus Pacearchaeota archaeon]
MYQLQKEPDKEFTLGNGARHAPLATLKDEYGGIAQICNDDHCYVLYLGGEWEDKGQLYQITNHWFSEAVAALKTLPLPR